jgi:hypothetical protein
MPEADCKLVNHDAGLSAGSRNPKIGEDLAAKMARAFLSLLFPLLPFFLIDRMGTIFVRRLLGLDCDPAGLDV